MEGIAAISARIAAIQGTLTSLAPPSTSAAAGGARPGVTTSSTGSTSGSGTTSSAVQFASVLAEQVGQSGVPAAGATQAMPAVPGFTPEQVANASAIVTTGQSRGLSLRDQAIGVMTAMGESSLRVLDHGDKAGPDSRGLFQQRDNGAWGTLAQRMDPAASATSFFTALERVGGRAGMSPTLVAHTVQRNADPNHYTRYWEGAVTMVSRLTGASAGQVAGG
ncbi:hypothetical protein [Actinotalea sp. K2]|uniref:hypothetical protein n=1 Tax=Actinotalea sp. K2 TaxID=2939438 RepID=UPI002016C8F2|nr:hypothetical protein [Actinotalea sp. K2]MCL3863265.1 hypothetical protein [Actinotalea sp. K2]